MNCFPLDEDFKKSVEYHVDSHVVKIILEGVQMLSTANQIHGIPGCYKMAHANHPTTQWASKSSANYNWLLSYITHLNQEWKYRFGHNYDHKSFAELGKMKLSLPKYVRSDITPMPQCMPESCQIDFEDVIIPVRSYRNYYQTSKQHIAKWTNRPIPDWYNYTGINTIETRK